MGRRWRRRTGHSAEGLQWGERKDVRGSICQPLSRVPAGFCLQCLPTDSYWISRPPARSSGRIGSYVLIWLIALALHVCPQTIKNSAFKTLSVNRQIQNASPEKREILCSTYCKLGAGGMKGKDGPKYWERSLTQWHFLHHKFHMDSPEVEPWSPWQEVKDKSPLPMARFVVIVVVINIIIIIIIVIIIIT